MWYFLVEHGILYKMQLNGKQPSNLDRTFVCIMTPRMQELLYGMYDGSM